MQTYQPGANTSVTFSLKDDAGNALAPVALSVRILDQDDREISGSEPVSIPNGTDLEISISGDENILGLDDERAARLTEMRVVELSVTTVNGVLLLTQGYILRAPAQLVVLKNSFQTYNSAVLRAQQMIEVDGWTQAPENERVAAMQDAFTRLTRYGYIVRNPQDPDAQNIIHWFDGGIGQIPATLWPVMTPVRWISNYPEQFREAMRRAQICEANARLDVSPIKAKRDAGILSEKIGESTVVFKPGYALDVGLSIATLGYLKGYLNLRVTTTRT